MSCFILHNFFAKIPRVNFLQFLKNKTTQLILSLLCTEKNYISRVMLYFKNKNILNFLKKKFGKNTCKPVLFFQILFCIFKKNNSTYVVFPYVKLKKQTTYVKLCCFPNYIFI